MNKLSPAQDRANESLCRSILAAANAHDEQREAAAAAPFLYQRIRNEIAQHPAPTRLTPKRTAWADWFAWQWVGGALAVLLLAVGLWQLLPPRAAAPIVQQVSVPAPTVPTPEIAEAKDKPVAAPVVRASHKTVPPRRSAPPRQQREAATSQFIPLTYVADAGSAGGHLIRIEVTPATLASLGFPLPPANYKEWVKADVMLGDDGLARAIRFVE